MTTTPSPIPPNDLLNRIEDDPSLLEPAHLRLRLELLDSLDAAFGDLDPNQHITGADQRIPKQKPSILQRAGTLRAQLEAANLRLYRTLQRQIVRQPVPCPLIPWLQALTGDAADGPGPSFDYRDDLVSSILALREPRNINAQQEPEMVFYQPTPVRHVTDLIRLTHLSSSDVLVDLGSGLGHVSLLASLLTRAESIGIEVEAAYVASAQECARRLHQKRTQFVHSDARTADLSRGTVFYLYTPFTGSILAVVLERLRRESLQRSIRICTLGPCTDAVARVPWLQTSTTPDPGRITLFHPRS